MDTSALVREIARYCAPLKPAEAAEAALLRAVGARRLAKAEHVYRQGETAEALYFVRSGLLRYYYLSDGTEHTGQFFSEGMFVADVAALTTGTPGQQNIDALEATETLFIPRSALIAAFDADHAYERFGRRLMEEIVVGSQRRSAGLLMLSPEERYEKFVAARPDVAPRVPQYTIASYLGITPEALSRIRRRRTSV